MNWNSLQAFLTMGGYGIYVWPSVVVCGLTMLVEVWLVRRRHQRALARLRIRHGRPQDLAG